MADNADNLGDLTVGVTGDFSELQASLDAAAAAATTGAETIANAFQAVSDASGLAGRDLEIFQQLVQADAEAGIALQQSLQDLASSAATLGEEIAGGAAAALDSLQASSAAAAASVEKLNTDLQQSGEAAQHDEEEMGGLRDVFEEIAAFAETLAITEGLVDLAKEALEASGNLATVTAAMGLMMGSTQEATEALEGLKDLALTSPFAFPDLIAAAQRLTAFGVEAQQLGPIIGSIADAAAATGRGIDQLTQAFSRVAQTGIITQRQLVQLGVTWEELGDIMGTSAEAAKTALTKGVLDSETALQVLHDTVESVYGGAAQTISQTITSQFAILKQQVDFTLEGIGTALTPFAAQIVSALSRIPPAIDSVVQSFEALDPETQQFVEVAAGIAVALGPAIAAITGLGLAVMAIGFAAPVIIPIAEAFAAIGVAVAAIHLSGLDSEVQTFIGDLENNAAGIKNLFGEVEAGIAGTNAVEQLAANAFVYLVDKWNEGNTAIKALNASGDLLQQTMGKISTITLGSFWSDLINQIPGIEGLRVAMVDLGAAVQFLGGSFDTMNAAVTASTLTLTTTTHTAMVQMANDALAAAQAQDQVYKQQQVQAQIAAAAAAQEAIALNNLNVKWQDNAAFALDMFNGIADGSVQASAAVSKLTSVLEQAEKEMDSLSSGSVFMLTGMVIPALKQAQAAVQDIANSEAFDKIANGILAIGTAADKVTANLPVDFQAMMDKVANGVNFQPLVNSLNKAIADEKLALSTLPVELQASLASGMQANIAIWQSESDRLQQMLSALKLIGQDTSMQKLATETQALAALQQQGALNSQQWQAGLNSLGTDLQKQVIPAMQQGVAVTPQLVSALYLISPALADAALRGVGPFTTAVTNMVETSRAGAISVQAAFKDLGVTSLQAAADSVTKSGNDIIAILKGVGDASQLSAGQMVADEQAVIKYAQDILAPMQNLGITISQDVLSQIAKISPAMALAATQGPVALQAAIDSLKTKVTIDTASMTDAFKALGIQTADTMQNNINLAQTWVTKLQDANAPMQAQLTAEIALYNNQMKYAQATGASADSTLQLTENLTAAKIQQQALTDATMGLSTLYTGIVNSMNTAWTSFEKGMGDAIVSGQNFGQAFDQVLTQLKKSIAELAVQYLGTQLKDAILTNTNALGSFNSIFNSVFSNANSVMNSTMQVAGASAAQLQSISDKLLGDLSSAGTAATNMSDSVSKAASQMQTATTGIASATSQLMSTLSLVFSAISAIAGIIGDIEIARTNTLLGEIEVSTRGALAQLISMQGTLNDIDAGVKVVNAFDNGFWPPAMAEALTDLAAIQAEIAAGVGVGGSGGSDATALAALLADLESLSEQVTNLTENIDTQTTATTTQTTATTDNTTTTTDNTTATTDNTTATVDQTAAVVNQATSTNQLSNYTDGAAKVITEFSNATGLAVTAVQSETNGVWQVITSLNGLVIAASSAASAIGQLSNTYGEAMGNFTSSLQAAINAGDTINGLTPGEAGYGTIPAGQTGGAGNLGPGPSTDIILAQTGTFVPGSTGPDIAPNYGYNAFNQPLGPPGLSGTGNVTLNVTVTGNSVTSAALVNQLANQVGDVIITSLRTRAGLKL